MALIWSGAISMGKCSILKEDFASTKTGPSARKERYRRAGELSECVRK